MNDELVRVLESVASRRSRYPARRRADRSAGRFAYVVGEKDIAQQRRSNWATKATTAAIIEGLQVGERVIAEGIQRVRPNTPVAPAPVEALSPPSKPAQRG